MIDKNNLDTIISDVTWSYEECGGEVPQNILDTLNEIKQVQAILSEYNVTPEIIREVLLTGQMFRNQPTLSECIKEWKKLGYSYHKFKKDEWEHERIRFYDDGTFIVIYLNDFSYYKASYYADNEGPLIYKKIKFEEHILIHKTVKALEDYNETKST